MSESRKNSRNFCATIFNQPLSILEQYTKDERFTYVIGQEEVCPETKREHLQCFFQLRSPVKFTTIKKLLPPGSHIEETKGSPEKNREYCSKESSRKPGSAPFEWGTIRGQGKRKDLDTFKEAIDRRDDELTIADKQFSVWARYPGLFQRYKSLKIGSRDRNQGPEVSLYTGPTGVGKTKRVFDEHKDSVYIKDGTKWWDGYNGQKCILLDDFQPTNYWTMQRMLNFLDRYPFKGEIKGGYVNINSPFIAITTNVDFFGLWPFDDPEHINALKRRISNTINL